jgi:excisionase family DNA binding protein
MNPLLDLPEVADRLGITVAKVRSLIFSKRLNATDVGTGKYHKWKVSEESLAEYMQSRRSDVVLQPKARLRSKAAAKKRTSTLASRDSL